MGKAQHTPGPWKLSGGDNGEWNITSPDANDPDEDWYIAQTFGGVGHGCDDDQSDANARLIAAAPDLLAALKAAVGHLLNAKIDLETGAPKQTAIATIEGGLRIAREAISKAPGEAE